MGDGSGQASGDPGAALRPGWRDRPHPARFDSDHPGNRAALAAHRVAVERGLDGYLDPLSGLFVMTALHLRLRGWCCDRGCRHCPYVGAQTTGDAP